MKKHRYTAAAVMLSFSMLTGAAAADYSDLKPHWAEQAMEFAVQSNLMDGISEYTFAADAPATRACLVQALDRMEHAPAADTVLDVYKRQVCTWQDRYLPACRHPAEPDFHVPSVLQAPV